MSQGNTSNLYAISVMSQGNTSNVYAIYVMSHGNTSNLYAISVMSLENLCTIVIVLKISKFYDSDFITIIKRSTILRSNRSSTK